MELLAMSKAAKIGTAAIATGLSAGVGLDIGGAASALIAGITAIGAVIVGYGVMRGRFQAKIEELERRADKQDETYEKLADTIADHNTNFTNFARGISQDVGELVGESRARRQGLLQTRADDAR